MEKVSMFLITVSFFLIGFKSFSQESFTAYDNSHVDRTYGVEIWKGKDGAFVLYIDAFSPTYETGGLRISSDQHADFVAAMTEARIKYQDWVQDAKSRNVKKLSKEMPIECKTGGFFLYAGSWRFQYAVSPTFQFKVFEKDGATEYLLIVNTGELTASNNEYMIADGFSLTFKSSDEIDAFTKSISTKAINEFRKQITELITD